MALSASYVTFFTCLWIFGPAADQACDNFSEHRCGDGQCVPKHFLCDGDDDCRDRSDEFNCTLGSETLQTSDWMNWNQDSVCDMADVHRCGEGGCVPKSYLCDGDYDCMDRSDEFNCLCNLTFQHRCGDGLCVPKSYLCDGSHDCLDKSDELNCSQITITAEPGETVTLPCEQPHTMIFNVKWIRPDLNQTNIVFSPTDPHYIFMDIEDDYNLEHQHESFKNRVQLKDSEMTDGDMSLILRNVTVNDTGTYECRVSGHRSRRVSSQFIHIDSLYTSWFIRIIHLDVRPLVQINLTAEPGDTVTLPCRALTHNTTVSTVKWIRPDLEPEDIFLYQDSWLVPEQQHPSYVDRVELKDHDMKDGDVSVILQDVTVKDTGTFECHVVQKEAKHRLSIVHLDVNSVQTPADLNLSVVRILLHLVVFCLFFISTLLMVSLYQCKPTGNNQPVSMTMSLSNRGGEDLNEQNDYIMDDVTIEHH
ncbi:G-protein coupled receptor GRL101-like [Anabas testudineus]|uniref:G-protein coupled receptor GRL101-like n=1 Tax=Anabas testudineus TaxID=64144 RepID=UPI00143D772A|nr:G-protein coupled receptor GRL101-like [Anabas testudineus]